MKIPEVNFYCVKRNANSELECRLIMSICFEGKRIIYYPGIVLKKYEWDKDEKQIVNRFDKDSINDSLQALKKQVIEIHQSLSIRYGRVTEKHFKDELKKLRILPGKTLSELFLDFMEKNSGVWATNTFLKCKSFYNWLKTFSDYYGSFVSIERVDQEFMQEFAIFLRNKGISNNTLYSYFNLFKWFLNWASSKCLLINDDYKSFKLASIKRTEPAKTTKIILSRNEILKLINSTHKERKLEHCRDIYCLMLFTGCTLSEVMGLKKTDVNHECIQVNGENSRTVPLNNYSGKIVSDYKYKYFKGGSFLPVYSEMTLNKYLRKLAGFLNFDRKLSIRRRGRLAEDSLSSLITMNSARSTFLYFASELGLSPIVVKKWSGKKNLDNVELYFGTTDKLEKKSISIINEQFKST